MANTATRCQSVCRLASVDNRSDNEQVTVERMIVPIEYVESDRSICDGVDLMEICTIDDIVVV